MARLGALRWALTSLLLSVLLGCSFGPSSLQNNRPSYNMVIQKTANEQLLLNLVRLKYREPVLFVDVTGITSQFTYSMGTGTSGITGSFKHGANSTWGIAGVANYTENPNISYAPLQGKEFAKQIMAETDMMTLYELYLSGWHIKPLMRLLVNRVGNLRNDPANGGDEYDKFIRFAGKLDDLQHNEQLRVEMKDSPDQLIAESVPAAQVTAERIISADKDGYYFMPRDLSKKDKLQLLKKGKSSYAVEVPQEKISELLEECGIAKTRAAAAGAQSLEFLGLQEAGTSPPGAAPPGGDSGKLSVPIQLRSLMDLMFYLAQGIQVPDSHADLVRNYADMNKERKPWRDYTSDLLNVHCSPTPPKDPYVAVQYRGCWFYIADNDLNSKDTFAEVSYLFALRSTELPLAPPVLTIPVAGR